MAAHGGEVEQATEFGVALFGEAGLVAVAPGLADSDVEADVGDELVGVGELLVDQAGREGRGGDGADAGDRVESRDDRPQLGRGPGRAGEALIEGGELLGERLDRPG